MIGTPEVVARFGSMLSDPEKLPAVEQAARSWWKYRDPRERMDEDRPLLDLHSFHSNGYVREKAVKQLARIGDGTELPFLLLRLNDWVPQVRGAAYQAIAPRLQPRYALDFLANVTLVARLRDRLLFDRIARVVASSAREALLRMTAVGSAKSCRAAFQLLVAAGESDDVLTAALNSRELSVLREGVRRVMSLPPDEMRAPLEKLLTDSAGSIRRVALMKWIATFPESAPEKLTAALLDENAGIRDRARFELRIDAAQFYRDAITRESRVRRVASAIAGLAETGVRADAEHLAAFLSHESPRIRRAAIRAIVKLGGDAYVDRVMELLRDPAPSVSAQARESLARRVASIDAEALGAIFRSTDLPHVRRNTLLLFDALSKWDGIVQLVLAAKDADAELVRDLAGRWNGRYNRSQTAPSKTQLARLDAALPEAEEVLGPDLTREIRFAMQSFR